MMLLRGAILGSLLLQAAALHSAPPSPTPYRITGIAVSSRGGTPIPYCRLVAAVAAGGNVAKANSNAQIQRGRPPQNGGARSGFGPPGPQIGSPRPTEAAQANIESVADSSGRFSLSLPHGGRWMLSGSARGFRPQNYDGQDGFYVAIILDEANPSYDLTLRLTPDSVLAGLVLDESGDPVVSAQVAALRVSPSVAGNRTQADRPRPVGFAVTDDRGRYGFGGLGPGNYLVRVQAQPWYSMARQGGRFGIGSGSSNGGQDSSPDPSLDFIYPPTWYPGTDDESTAASITLKDGEERQADFHLTAIPAIHLRFPRADVQADREETGPRSRPQPQRPATVTRMSGDTLYGMGPIGPTIIRNNEWDFGGLSPGTYEVRIPSADGKSSEVRQLVVRSGSQTVLTLDDSKPLVPVQLTLEGIENAAATTIDFLDHETGAHISSAPPFRGRGGFQSGPLPDNEGSEPNDTKGRTVMLPAHEFTISIAGGSGAYLTGLIADSAKVEGSIVTIDGPSHLTLSLANKHAEVDGFARIEGKPAVGAMVLLVPVTLGRRGDLTTIQRDETNSDGSFTLSGITPGQYILVAIDHGWEIDWQDPATLGRYLIHGLPIDLGKVAQVHEEIEALPRN